MNKSSASRPFPLKQLSDNVLRCRPEDMVPDLKYVFELFGVTAIAVKSASGEIEFYYERPLGLTGEDDES